MSYALLKENYDILSEEQQKIVYNLVLSLSKLNERQKVPLVNKRVFGKFAGRATATFSDNWEMSEEELCNL